MYDILLLSISKKQFSYFNFKQRVKLVRSLFYFVLELNGIKCPLPGGGKELSGRHDAGGGVLRVTQKSVSFTIVHLGGQLQDLPN